MIGDPKSKAIIVGVLKTVGSISGSIKSSTILTSVEAGKIDIIHSDLPDYVGLYEAIPSGDEQIFSMVNKTTRENFIVRAIPYEEVPNSAGGITAIIGSGE